LFALQLKAMREVMQGDASNPKVTMGNNYRPVMHLHQRTVRTNINFNNPVCLFRRKTNSTISTIIFNCLKTPTPLYLE